MRAARASKPDGYLLGSYRIATAPEPNSSRLTSFKSIRFDSPANNVGPWPVSLGCITNSTHRSIPAPPTPAGASRLPRQSLTDPELRTAFPRSPCTSSAFQSTRSRCSTRLLCRVDRPAKGSHARHGRMPPSFRRSPGQRGGHRPGRGFPPRDDVSLRPRELHDDRSTRPM